MREMTRSEFLQLSVSLIPPRTHQIRRQDNCGQKILCLPPRDGRKRTTVSQGTKAFTSPCTRTFSLRVDGCYKQAVPTSSTPSPRTHSQSSTRSATFHGGSSSWTGLMLPPSVETSIPGGVGNRGASGLARQMQVWWRHYGQPPQQARRRDCGGRTGCRTSPSIQRKSND
jgi:hypothetical protein